jgi:hypothetical protein
MKVVVRSSSLLFFLANLLLGLPIRRRPLRETHLGLAKRVGSPEWSGPNSTVASTDGVFPLSGRKQKMELD